MLPRCVPILTHHYRIFDLRLASEIEIPELPADPGGRADLQFALAGDPLPEIERWSVCHEWPGSDGRMAITYSETPHGSVLRFAAGAEFELDPTYTRIMGHPCPGVSPERLRHLLIDQIVPRALAQQGDIVIHASAVRVDGGCLAFLGPSGVGKSTLAASFLAIGMEPFADDALKATCENAGVIAIPSYPGVRIWPASERILRAQLRTSLASRADTVKRRYAPRGCVRQPDPLKLLGVFVLDGGQGFAERAEPKVRECTGSELMASLLRHTFELNPRSRLHRVRQLGSLAWLANSEVGFFHLSFPRRFDRLPQVRNAVLDAIGMRRESGNE